MTMPTVLLLATTTGGRYGGVGMQIEDQHGAIVIQRVYPNTPAERAGIHEGDRIIEIDANEIEPYVTWGTSPGMVVSVSGQVPDPAETKSEADRRAARSNRHAVTN